MHINIHVNISIIRPSEAADNHRNILKRCDVLSDPVKQLTITETF